jgi:hypothetical protein
LSGSLDVIFYCVYWTEEVVLVLCDQFNKLNKINFKKQFYHHTAVSHQLEL